MDKFMWLSFVVLIVFFCTACFISIIGNVERINRSAFNIGCMDSGKLTKADCDILYDKRKSQRDNVTR